MTTPEKLRRRQRFESLLIAVLCTLLVAAWLYFRARSDEADRDLQAQANANSAINSCLSSWAQDLTLALQDRDAVNRTARAAQRETWAEISDWLKGTSTDRAPMIAEIDRFRTILRRLDRLTSLNPYPQINPCFVATGNLDAVALVAYWRSSRSCLGMPVTILGTRRPDTIVGTDEADVIFAGRGKDLISAERGHDYICAGRGPDVVNGGPGRDAVRGGSGSDLCIQTEAEKGC